MAFPNRNGTDGTEQKFDRHSAPAVDGACARPSIGSEEKHSTGGVEETYEKSVTALLFSLLARFHIHLLVCECFENRFSAKLKILLTTSVLRAHALCSCFQESLARREKLFSDPIPTQALTPSRWKTFNFNLWRAEEFFFFFVFCRDDVSSNAHQRESITLQANRSTLAEMIKSLTSRQALELSIGMEAIRSLGRIPFWVFSVTARNRKR